MFNMGSFKQLHCVNNISMNTQHIKKIVRYVVVYVKSVEELQYLHIFKFLG